jgi:hypothetical protein
MRTVALTWLALLVFGSTPVVCGNGRALVATSAGAVVFSLPRLATFFVFFSHIFSHFFIHSGPLNSEQSTADAERRKAMLEQNMLIQKQRLEAMASLSAEALLPAVKPEAALAEHPHQRLGAKTGPRSPQQVLLRDFRIVQSDPSPSTHAHKVFSLKRQYFVCLMQKVGCSNWLHYIKVWRNQTVPLCVPAAHYNYTFPAHQKQHGADLKSYLYASENDAQNDLWRLNFKLHKAEPAAISMFQNLSSFKAAIVRDPWSRAVRFFVSSLFPSPGLRGCQNFPVGTAIKFTACLSALC